MREGDVAEVVRILNPYAQSKTTTHHVISCPFAKWNHKSEIDKHPSMAISYSDKEESLAHCFSCKVGGTFAGVLLQLAQYLPEVRDLAQRVYEMDKQDLSTRLDKIGTMYSEDPEEQVKQSELEDSDVWPENEITAFLGKVPKYALDRGLTLQSCKKWELGYDADPNDPRLVFPVRRMDGKLVGVVGRTIADKEPKYKDYFNFKKSRYLYGEHLIEPGKPIVVVEGNIDTVWTDQVTDFNVVGLNGSKASERQIEKLVSFDRRVILMLDGDEAGKRGTWGYQVGNKKYKGIVQGLKGKVPISIAKIREGEDPGSLRKEDLLERVEEAKYLL